MNENDKAINEAAEKFSPYADMRYGFRCGAHEWRRRAESQIQAAEQAGYERAMKEAREIFTIGWETRDLMYMHYATAEQAWGWYEAKSRRNPDNRV
jgi:hypothetical protein